MAAMYSIFETKTHLSELLRLVKKGKDLIITERGNPIAKIIPFTPQEETLAQKLDSLEKSGPLLRAKKRKSGMPDTSKLKKVNGALKRFLEDR